MATPEVPATQAVHVSGYPYHPPRVDAEQYQAVIPDMVPVDARTDPRAEGNRRLLSRLTFEEDQGMWNPVQASELLTEEQLNAWLKDAKDIVAVHRHKPVLSGHELPPFDSDDIALAFLHKCGYNVALARLELTAALGYGHEETVLDALTAIRMQRSLGSRAIGRGPVDTVPMPFEVYQALKRRDESDAACLAQGIVVTGNEEDDAMSEEGSDHGEIKPAGGSLVAGDDVSPGSDSDVRSDASDDEAVAAVTSSKGKRSSKVKESNPEFQKQSKWRKWLSEAQAAVNIGQNSRREFPDIATLVSLRSRALALPKLNIYHADGGTLSQQVQQTTIAVTAKLKAATEWRTRVRDALARTPVTLQPVTLNELEILLSESNGLYVKLDGENLALQRIVKQAKEWNRAASSALADMKDAASFTAQIMATVGGQDASEQATDDNRGEYITLRRRRRSTKAAAEPGEGQQQLPASQSQSSVKGPSPLPLHTLQQLIRDGDELPIELPMMAELKARLDRVRTVVSRVKEVFPNPSCHSRGPAGPRLPQGIGLSIEKGATGMGGDGVTSSGDDGLSAAAVLPAPAVSVSEEDVYDMEFSGVSLKGLDKSSYVSYTVGVNGVGSGSGLGNGVRRARVPLCHVESLTMDALETGVKFEEGETVLNALRKTHVWLKRARTAMSRHTGVTLAVFRNLIRDAESVPVDLWSHVRDIRRMLGRARVWVETVRKMFPAASQARARRGVGASESKRFDAEKPVLEDVERLLDDAKLHGLPAGIEEVATLEDVIGDAEDWIEGVRAYLDTLPDEDAAEELAANAAVSTDANSTVTPTVLDDDDEDEGAPVSEKKRRRGDGDENAKRSKRGRSDGDTKQSVLSKLEGMLREAGELPVVVEEAKLLQQEVVARRWMLRAKRALDARPRVDTMEHLLKELKDLKGQFPPLERTSTWSRLKEESEMRRLIKNAEKWLSQAHLAENRRMPIRRVKALVESDEISGINVDVELKSLETMVAQAESWETRASKAIRCAEMSLSRHRALMKESGRDPDGGDGEATPSEHNETVAPSVAASAPNSSEDFVYLSFDEVRELLDEAETLSVIPSGEDALKRARETVNGWLAQLLSLLPTAESSAEKLPALRAYLLQHPSKAAKSTGKTVGKANGKGKASKRKRVAGLDIEDDLIGDDVGEGDGGEDGPEEPTVPKRFPNPSTTLEQLHELLKFSAGLAIDVAAEIDAVRSEIYKAEAWIASCQECLRRVQASFQPSTPAAHSDVAIGIATLESALASIRPTLKSLKESAEMLAVTPVELEALQALVNADQWAIRAVGVVADIQSCVVTKDDTTEAHSSPIGSRRISTLLEFLNSFSTALPEDALKSKKVTIPPDMDSFDALCEAALDAAIVTPIDIERLLASSKALALDHSFTATLSASHKHGVASPSGTLTIPPLPGLTAVCGFLEARLAEVRSFITKIDKVVSSANLTLFGRATDLLASALSCGVALFDSQSVANFRSCFRDALGWQYRARLVLAGLVPSPSGGYKQRQVTLYDDETGTAIKSSAKHASTKDVKGKEDPGSGNDDDDDDEGVGEAFPTLAMISQQLESLKGIRIAMPEVAVLQELHAKASQWISAVARTGIEKGLANVPQLEALLKQLPAINVDLNEYSCKLKQAVRLYCVCRNPFRPPMLTCKMCRAQFHASCMGHDGRDHSFVCLECSCRNATRALIDAAITAMDKIEEVLLDNERVGPPPLESLTADIEATPENLLWYGENISLARRLATGNPAPAAVSSVTVPVRSPVFAFLFGSAPKPARDPISAILNAPDIVIAWVNYARKVIEPTSAQECAALRTSKTLQALMSIAMKIGVATCCPPADPVYVAIRAIIWLNQVANVVGRLMKPQELERVYAAALSVPITDPRVVDRMRSLIGRYNEWEGRAVKSLNARGDVRIPLFKKLLTDGQCIPIEKNELEAGLEAVISDNGRPWCLCRGLNRGFMVGCEYCDNWFHGPCVGVTPEMMGAPPANTATSSQADVDSSTPPEATEASVSSTAVLYVCPTCCNSRKIPYKYKLGSPGAWLLPRRSIHIAQPFVPRGSVSASPQPGPSTSPGGQDAKPSAATFATQKPQASHGSQPTTPASAPAAAQPSQPQ